MADAGGAARAALRVDGGRQVGELARLLGGDKPARRRHDGDARGVVTTVFEPAQAVENDVHSSLPAYVTHDAAHDHRH
jgi:hypothetical protein